MSSPPEVADASMQAVMAKDKPRWLALFADDAWVCDPVGPAPYDPEGKGFRGKDEIGRLFDMTVATFRSIAFTVSERYLGGNEVASCFSVEIVPHDGASFSIDGIAVHITDRQGKLSGLRTYLTPAPTGLPGRA